MVTSLQYSVRSVIAGVVLSVLCSVPVDAAQRILGRSDCQAPQGPSVGVAFGRSSPYISLAPDVFDMETAGSVSGGMQIAGRADLSIVGPLRLRIEGASARWDVRQKRYDPDAGFQLIEDRSVGHMATRQLVALVGVRAGRAPACAHVSVGPGLYSMGFRGTSIRRPGIALAAGIEIPTGDRGAVQADVNLHLILTRDGQPITSSTAVPAASLLIGWAYRF